MEAALASFSRNLYKVPGGYFFAKYAKKVFDGLRDKNNESWRTFSFRGVKIKVDINTHMGGLIYWRGAHEWAPVYAIEHLVKEGDVVLDIGASQGEYTLWAAKKCGKNGRVIAIEPLTKMFAQLKENIAINPDLSDSVILVNTGLSDKVGKMPIYGYSGEGSKDGLHEGMPTLFRTASRNQLIEEINLVLLDDVIKDLEVKKVDFIKIDVEGAELQILKGGIKILKEFKPILLIEASEETFNAAGYSQVEFFNFLNGFGYKYYLAGNRGELTPIEVKDMPYFCNIVAKV
jgi:FkbM family methyltransferase